jgi:UDP-N-acetylglucosamine acyltransferase
MEKIHPTAIIASGAEIDASVEIGPYSIIGPNVKISAGTVIHSHVVLDGHVTIGENNTFFQFCSIGAPPQDLSYKNEPTRVEIGSGNVFREYVSIHRATTKENHVTIIGNDNLLMAHVHVGHDGIIGNNCILVNSLNLAGHVHIQDRVIIGGGCSVAQFTTIGRGAYIGGATGIDKDIPPFCTAVGNRAKLKGINIIGLRRAGYSKESISEVVDFFRYMESSTFSPRSFVGDDTLLENYKENEIVQEIVTMIRKSEVGIAPFVSA